MHTQPQSNAPTWAARVLHEPIIIGTLCGLASAVGYTAANSCLRAVSDCDPVWVSFAKAFPTVALFGPILLVRMWKGQEQFPSWPQLRVLIFAAVICQLFGNVVFQWSLGVIGMALTVPLTLGTMIAGAAVMGRIWLHEPVTIAMAGSMAVLVAAVFVLSSGAKQATTAPTEERLTAGERSAGANAASEESAGIEAAADSEVIDSGSGQSAWRTVFMGVGAACLAGLAYAYLGVAIRVVVTDSTSLWMTTVTVTATGLLTLGLLGCCTPGLAAWKGTSATALWTMMAAGVFNALAFLALTRALQLVPVAYVNALNASQAAMGAVAGVALFAEPSSWQLWVGVGLTAVGLLTMRRPESGKPAKQR